MEKVAILLATYNGETYIKEQLDSIQQQTYTNFDCFIHDDGSEDRTVDIIKLYCEKNAEQFHIVNGKSTGSAKNNFFYLLKSVEADFYFFSDQDDYWDPHKLEHMLSDFKKNIEENPNEPCMEFCDLKVVDEKRGVLSNSYMKYTGRHKKDFSPIYLLHRNYAPGCASLLNRKLRDMILLTDDFSQIVMHDWWGMLVAAVYGRVFYFDEPLVEYRQHNSNVLGAQRYVSFAKIKKITRKKQETTESICQALRFAKQLQIIGQKSGIHTAQCDVINEYILNQKLGKIDRILYFYRVREHFTPMATLSNVLFG